MDADDFSGLSWVGGLKEFALANAMTTDDEIVGVTELGRYTFKGGMERALGFCGGKIGERLVLEGGEVGEIHDPGPFEYPCLEYRTGGDGRSLE